MAAKPIAHPTYAGPESDRYRHADQNADAHAERHRYADQDADTRTDSNGDRDTDAHTDEDADGHADPQAHVSRGGRAQTVASCFYRLGFGSTVGE